MYTSPIEPLRHRLKVLIEKVNADIRQWVADGDLFDIDIDFCPGRANGRFAWPILVPYRAAHPGQAGSKAQGKDLTAHDDLHPRVALPSFFEQEPIHGGRSQHHGCRRTANLLHSRATVTDKRPSRPDTNWRRRPEADRSPGMPRRTRWWTRRAQRHPAPDSSPRPTPRSYWRDLHG